MKIEYEVPINLPMFSGLDIDQIRDIISFLAKEAFLYKISYIKFLYKTIKIDIMGSILVFELKLDKNIIVNPKLNMEFLCKELSLQHNELQAAFAI